MAGEREDVAHLADWTAGRICVVEQDPIVGAESSSSSCSSLVIPAISRFRFAT